MKDVSLYNVHMGNVTEQVQIICTFVKHEFVKKRIVREVKANIPEMTFEQVCCCLFVYYSR